MPRAISWASIGLLRTVDAGYGALLLIAPLLMGGRHPVGRLFLVTVVVIMAVAWLARQSLETASGWRRSSAEWWLLAALTLLILQQVSLPPSILRTFSPHISDLLPLWSATEGSVGHLGGWSHISLTPERTSQAFVLLAAYGVLFLVTVQRLEQTDDVVRLLRVIGCAAAVMATFGILQYLASNGKFAWVYRHPFRDTSRYVMGSFINRNHFAHFLALGIGPLAWMLVDTRRVSGKRRAASFVMHRGTSRWVGSVVMASGALVIVLLAGLLSLSRGGAIAMVIALAVCGAIFYRGGLVRRDILFVLGGVALLLVVSLLVAGHRRVADRLGGLASGSMDQLDPRAGRRTLWSANLAVFRDFPLIGTGVGSHRQVCPIYLPETYSIEYTHADNGYLQVASEAGIAGLALLTVAIGLCAGWCGGALRRATSGRQIGCLGAVAAGLLASAVHSIVDFVWYVPACMTVTVLLAACAHRLWISTRPTSATRPGVVWMPRPVWIAITAMALLAGFRGIDRLARPAMASPHWDGYLRNSFQTAKLSQQLRQAEAHGDLTNGNVVGELQALAASRIASLEAVLRHDPRHARAHIRLAAAYLDRFDRLQRASENAIDLRQIREAALASHFASSAALNGWLDRVLGDRRQWLERALWHTRRGLALSPLYGQAYLSLADLFFLEAAHHGSSPTRGKGTDVPRVANLRFETEVKQAYVDQAIRVRPHDGDVLFEAGREAVLAGDYLRAVACWKESFAQGGTYQTKIIQRMAGQVPATFFLEAMEPDLAALRRLAEHYQKLDKRESYLTVVERLSSEAAAEATRCQGERSAQLWLEAHRAFGELADPVQAEHCLRQAVAGMPYDEAIRRQLGLWLLARKRFGEAETELRWCARFRGTDRRLRRALRDAVAGRVASQDRTVSLEQRPSPQGLELETW
ncbi:MAG: O-antigen ligase family protein [Pirellulales bacterium]